MKTLLLIFVLSVAASAQLPCLVDTSMPGLNATAPYKDGSGRTYLYHKENWTLRPAWSQSYKVGNGGAWFLDIYMPVAGNCVGYFSSYDDSDDLNSNTANLLGKYIERPKGDIEILILTPQQMMFYGGGNKTPVIYTSGRRMQGKFDVHLEAGYYTIAISNRHSKLAPKSVDFILGRKTNPKTLAP